MLEQNRLYIELEVFGERDEYMAFMIFNATRQWRFKSCELEPFVNFLNSYYPHFINPFNKMFTCREIEDCINAFFEFAKAETDSIIQHIEEFEQLTKFHEPARKERHIMPVNYVPLGKPVYFAATVDYNKPKTNKEVGDGLVTKIIVNGPATIVFWKDGTKTVVKCQEGDTYDLEKAFAMAFLKHKLGNEGKYNSIVNYILKNKVESDV